MRVEDIRRVAVVGAGLMGHGIAQEFALAGYEVRINDLTQEILNRAMKRIERNLQMLVGAGLITAHQAESAPRRIQASTTLKDVVAEADLVVEAVYEDLPLKQEIFRELDSTCPEPTILASTTSTFIPSRLAAKTRRRDKVLVAHYWNPPYLMPLVEIARSDETSDETVATVYELLRRLGKHPVILKKEVPGFIGNRLQIALLREALAIVQQGIASPQDVDDVIKTSFGRRLGVAGVFEVLEIAGWDLFLAIARQLLPVIESSSEVPRLLRKKVEQGELGVKTGKGFYEWTPESAEALRQRIAQALIQRVRQG